MADGWSLGCGEGEFVLTEAVIGAATSGTSAACRQ
jgi:hypothetical protein